MTVEMWRYLDKLLVYLASGSMRARIEVESASSVVAVILDEDGQEQTVLNEMNIRDILDSMRRAKAAFKMAVEIAPHERRGESEE